MFVPCLVLWFRKSTPNPKSVTVEPLQIGPKVPYTSGRPRAKGKNKFTVGSYEWWAWECDCNFLKCSFLEVAQLKSVLHNLNLKFCAIEARTRRRDSCAFCTEHRLLLPVFYEAYPATEPKLRMQTT